MTSVSPEVTVGIDIGTTSVKAVAADGDGNVVARARIPHRLLVPAPSRLEHDANQAWRRGPRRALAALDRRDAVGISVTAMVPSMTSVDRRGVARTPGLLYGDERGRSAQATGPAGSGEAVEFLRWTSTEQPRAAGYWNAQATANHALSGEAVMSTTSAFSGHPLYTGTGWNQEVLDECAVTDAQLPRVELDGTAVGKVGDAVLDAGSIDALCEQLVAGADHDGDVLVICGTTLIVWAVIPDWVERDGVWTIPHTAPGKMLIGGPSNAGGLFLTWVQQLAGRTRGGSELDPARVPVWAPYIRGERVPFHDPDRRATVDGLDLTHGPAALLRSAYEASGFVTRHILDLAGVEPRRIVATGGGTRVPQWLQALADCTRLPVDVCAVPEGAALGAAFLARVAAGLESSMIDASRWARIEARIEPEPRWADAADGRYARFRELSGA